MKKGFTLVELLAVIVILALIALITIPMVLGTVDKSEDSADKRSAENYRRAIKNSIARENLNGKRFNPTSCTVIEEGNDKGNISCSLSNGETGVLKIKIEGKLPTSGSIRFEEGEPVDTLLCYKSYCVRIDEKGNSTVENSSTN